MRRVLVLLAFGSTSLAACLFPDLGVLGGGDGGTSDSSANDVAVDANTRIKNITFENGLIVDPVLGVAAANYPVDLLGPDAGALADAYSVATHSPGADASNLQSALTQDFSPPTELFVSMLVRVDAMPANVARFVKIGNNQTTFEAYIVPNGGASVSVRFKVRLTTSGSTDKTLGDSPAYSLGQLVRVGFVLGQQSALDAGDAVVQGFVSSGTSPFGAPVASSNQETLLGPSDEIVLGASTADFVAVTFDDVRLDSAQMPEP